MKFWPALLAVTTLGAGSAAQAVAATVATMRDHRRILLIAAPAGNPEAADQLRLFGSWRRQAADRDISVVELVGGRVTGAADTPKDLRKVYGLDLGRFQVLLIGKDGTVALRSARPVSAVRLQATIDAMPMRRAGER